VSTTTVEIRKALIEQSPPGKTPLGVTLSLAEMQILMLVEIAEHLEQLVATKQENRGRLLK
jgi:hypothetical protein